MIFKMFNLKVLCGSQKHVFQINVVDLQASFPFGSSRSDNSSRNSLFSSSPKASPHTKMNAKMKIIFISVKDLQLTEACLESYQTSMREC